MKIRFTLADGLIWAALTLAAFSCLFPMINTLAISFSDKTNAALGNVILWPMNFNIASYLGLVEDEMFYRSFINSVVRVILGGIINVTLCVVMAYPLSKDKSVFRARNYFVWVVIFTMLFYGGLVPEFILIKNLKLIDTIWALVLPGAVPVFSLIILMNFYKGIPKALEEAALADGASPFYILLKIYIPLSSPSIATITLFSVVRHWNAFFDGKIYINTPLKMPLQTYIQTLTAALSPAQMASMSPEEILQILQRSNLTFNSAKVIMSMIPILLIYPFLQRYFVKGIVMGAVKE